jgi:hypothetical protein
VTNNILPHQISHFKKDLKSKNYCIYYYKNGPVALNGIKTNRPMAYKRLININTGHMLTACIEAESK